MNDGRSGGNAKLSQVTDDTPEMVSLAGSLWLVAAIAATRHADEASVIERLDQAARHAARLGADANHGFTAFGPTNVALHRVSTATRMGDPLRVLSDAATVDTGALPVALNGRRAQLHLDVAGAQSQRRHDPEAVYHLREAERIAPEVLRYYLGAHTLLRELLRRERRGQTPALRPLTARAGAL